jgi:uncharacterized protein with gpF-like domain
MADLKRSIEYALLYIQEKAGAIKRPSGAYLRKQEMRLEKKIVARFKKQLSWLVEEAQKLPYFQDSKGFQRYASKSVREDIDAFLEGLPENEEMVNDIGQTVNDTYKRGARDINAKLGMAKVGVSFDLVNEDAANYLRTVKNLQLSNFRGSIQRETKARIQKILVDAIEEGTAYGEVARKIKSQAEAGVFSRARGELIAVNQVGRAYGNGNDTMVRRFMLETSSLVQKSWQTVKDQNVTEECKHNEEQGWLGMEESFLSSDKIAPRLSNPRCRCVTSYRVVNMRGEPI